MIKPGSRRTKWACCCLFTGPFAPACMGAANYNISRAHGATPGQARKSGFQSAVTTSAYMFIGSQFNSSTCQSCWEVGKDGTLQRTLSSRMWQAGAHAMVGGINAKLQGGKFAHGFYSAGITKALNVNSMVDGTAWYDRAARIALAGVISGTISEVTGGKFRNGAISAMIGQAFNGETNFDLERAKKLALGLAQREAQPYRSDNEYFKGNRYEFQDFVQYVLSSCDDDSCFQITDDLYVSTYSGAKSMAANNGTYPKGALDGSVFEGETCGTCPIKNVVYGAVASAYGDNAQVGRMNEYFNLSKRVNAPLLILTKDKTLYQYHYEQNKLNKIQENYSFK